jgi:biopolymer transport protein ExbD
MKRKSNQPIVFIALFTVLIFCSACPRKPDKQTSSNFGPPIILPKGVKNAAVDSAAQNESAVIVSVPQEEEFFVGANQYSKDDVAEKVSRLLAGQAESTRIVYLAAGHFLDYGVVANVTNSLRKEGVVRIGLLVEPAGNGRSSLRVEIPAEPSPNDDLSKLKPNPLTLVVSITKDLKLKLNQESMGEAEEPGKLTQMLTDVFQRRKELHDYKPGMETRNDVPEDERVEKTIVVKAQRSTRYGDVVRLIDAIKGAGGNPIVLQIDDLSD